MIRRLPHASTLAAIFAVAVVGSAYGCGGSDGDSGDGSSGGTPGGDDGSIDDASPSEPDGTTSPGTDGSTKPGADGSTSKDSGKSSDGSIDAPLDAADAADASLPPPHGPLSDDYVDYDVNHILMTGQSNIVSNGGEPPLSLAQPFTNLMFDTGVMPMGSCTSDGCKVYQTPASLVPLIEGDVFFTRTPTPYRVETPANGMADEISYLAQQKFEFGARAGYPTKHDVLASIHGRSGNTYWCLRKGFCSYNADPPRSYASPFGQGMMEVASGKALATAAGKTYVVRAAMTVHGESDHYSYIMGTQEFPLDGTDGSNKTIKDYKDGLIEWQRDYESSVQAITGQVQHVPLLISGLSGYNTSRTSQVLQWQLDAHIAAPGKVVYVTPAYMLSPRNDCLHFDSTSYRKLGEYFGKVYAKIVFGGETWEPVRPKAITRAGAVITVQYYVPAPPLTIDTVHVVNPGNLGFDVLDNGAMVAISSVVVSAADTVTITLAALPSGANMRIRYAQNQVPNSCIGNGINFQGGNRGNLRDSDATPSQYGNDLWNWGVPFDFTLP